VPFGIFTETNNRVLGLSEKPTFKNYANAGIYILKKELINQIPFNSFYNITDLMSKIIENNQVLIHNPIMGYWIDIGQPQDYLNAKEIVKHISNVND
jgi:NDP-sugar pyrophosphorylase family protein